MYFDTEEMYEAVLVYQCGVPWVKNNVRKCLADFSAKYDFNKSDILQDLYEVYVNKGESGLGKLYVVPYREKEPNKMDVDAYLERAESCF